MPTEDEMLYRKAYELGQLDAEISDCEAKLAHAKYQYTETWRTETRGILSCDINSYEKEIKKLLRKRARIVKEISDKFGIPKETLKRKET